MGSYQLPASFGPWVREVCGSFRAHAVRVWSLAVVTFGALGVQAHGGIQNQDGIEGGSWPFLSWPSLPMWRVFDRFVEQPACFRDESSCHVGAAATGDPGIHGSFEPRKMLYTAKAPGIFPIIS